MRRGIFITFEGPEGSGKSTHLRLLADWLQRQGWRVAVTREPGGTEISQPIRALLLNTPVDISPLAELLLYEADRAQHVTESVLPALQRGTLVLCDRYTDSTLAYQGFGRKLNKPLIQTLNHIASQDLMPDLTILLDVSTQKGLRQAHQKKKGHDRLEQAGMAFHQRVRQGFLTLARKEPKRFRVIRQQKDISQTQKLVREAVMNYLNKEDRGQRTGDRLL